MDNLYNSIDFSWNCEAGITVIFEIPPGWTADVNFDGDMSARTIDWKIKAVHIVGTLRGNRGSEREYQWKEKMGKRATEELKAKPLQDRIKARVTDDEAQVMTISIFEKNKAFQMVDTEHTGVEVTTKVRKVFDRSTGRPGKTDIPITTTQNEYNLTMGFVDQDDLLASFYK